MALLLKEDRIEISIPNSEASICAQHEGIKDRSVGSYYMSDIYENVKSFLNDFEGNFYIDLSKTYFNMNKLYEDIEKMEKISLFKSGLMDQYAIMDEIYELLNSNRETLVQIPNPSVNDNIKYLKFDRTNKYIKMFEDLLLGDVTSITIKKISKDCFIISGSYLDEYKTKLDYNLTN